MPVGVQRGPWGPAGIAVLWTGFSVSHFKPMSLRGPGHFLSPRSFFLEFSLWVVDHEQGNKNHYLFVPNRRFALGCIFIDRVCRICSTSSPAMTLAVLPMTCFPTNFTKL